jgi:tetratricopeptide (TPR) repeat protein
LRWLFVIARNSSFTYKNRAIDVRQVGRELGVRYVLEGSVRKAADRVRIAAQLIDASDGTTLWAGRSEGQLRDLFDLQDRVTLHTIAAIAPRLEEAEIARARRKPTDSLDAYDCFLRGMAALHLWTRAGNEEGLHYFKRAVELDPDFAAACGLAARCYTQRKAGGWMIDGQTEEAEALRLAARAAELGRDDAVALANAGFTYVYVDGRHLDGGALIERALQLNPNYAWGWFFSGFTKATGGEPEVAIEHCRRALELSPNDPHVLNMHLTTAFAHFIAGRYADAVNLTERASRSHPNRFAKLAIIAASHAQLGEVEKARPYVKQLMELEPGLCLANLRHRYPIRRDEDYARWSEGLKAAGLPA